MKEVTHIRRGRHIQCLGEGGVVTTTLEYESINLAKRASREMQKSASVVLRADNKSRWRPPASTPKEQKRRSKRPHLTDADVIELKKRLLGR